jgi:hypothetical protein
MMRASAAVLAACLAQAVGATTPADYAYVFPIDTAASATAGSSAWQIELTPDVYRFVQDADLRDLEVFNAEGHPVPLGRITIEPTATARERSAVLPVLDLPASTKATTASDLRLVIDRDADGRLRRIDAGEQPAATKSARDWLVDASALDRPIERLTLSWREPASGIVARFMIEAGDDLEHWRTAGNGTVLVLEQQGARLERRDIALGGVRAKYLRLRRLDDGDAISGLAVEARSVEHGLAAPARAWILATPKAASADARAPAGTSRFEYTLAAALPVDMARVELANDNALAQVALLARSSDAPISPWTRVAALTAFRLRQANEPLRNGDVDVRSMQRLGEFRIEAPTTIANAPQLTLGWRPDRFVFLAEGNAPYVLAAGSRSARRPDYPIGPALASLSATLGHNWQPPFAALAGAQASAGDLALLAPPPPLPWRRWLLWAILAGGAALIAALSLSLLRDAKPPE